MKRIGIVAAAGIACLAMGTPLNAASVAQSAPVTDCPLVDAPFSIDTPFIDILLSEAARSVVEQELDTDFDKLPPQFAGTQTPSFAAILTVKEAISTFGGDKSALATIDERLRALPVTDADRRARCARYDNDVPTFDLADGKPHVLLFEKVVGFRHDAIPAAHDAFIAMAKDHGWDIAATDRAGAINDKTLDQFDAIIWNNVSGDVLTLSQRQALRDFVEGGGGFVAVHGSGGDPAYFWDWYADTLIGARFAGHPMDPQFQEAEVEIEDATHPIAANLPSAWVMEDEWYSFKTNPRDGGARVIATLDESTYKPEGRGGVDLAMGDHPIAWSKIVGKGRVFYSALGHRAETYSDDIFQTMLGNAIGWTLGESAACECEAP